MSQDEWDGLKPGDIVIERRSKTPRIVLATHKRPWRAKTRVSTSPFCMTLELRKLRGWRYNCPNTLLMPGDWRHRLDVAHGKHARVQRSWFKCQVHGWWHVHRRGGRIHPVYCIGMGGTPPRPDWSAPEYRHAR
jgi:hypothetical protein